MTKIRTLTAMGVLLMAALQTQAITVNFRTGGTETGPYYGNEILFSAGDIDITVSAWAWDTHDSEWELGHLGQSSSYGLYNRNSHSDGSHTVDNQGWIDYIQFEFSETVDLGWVYMYVFGNDGDFEYWTDSTTGQPNGTGAPTSGGIGVNNSSSGWVSLSGVTDYLLIGAEYFNDRAGRWDRDDQFKIKKLNYEPSPVPDGGVTLALLGLSLLGLAAGRKRFGNR